MNKKNKIVRLYSVTVEGENFLGVHSDSNEASYYITLTLSSKFSKDPAAMYYYMHISLNFEKDQENRITPAFFKENIIRCVRIVFGESAGSANIDLLKYNPGNLNAVIRVPEHLYVKVHAALTFCGTWHSQPCFYIIHKTSPLLLSLSQDSRNYEH